MKSKRFQTVFCLVLGLILAAMTGTARADGCDDHQATSKEKSKTEYRSTQYPVTQGFSRDQELSPYRMQEAQETADLPGTGKAITDSEGLNSYTR